MNIFIYTIYIFLLTLLLNCEDNIRIKNTSENNIQDKNHLEYYTVNDSKLFLKFNGRLLNIQFIEKKDGKSIMRITNYDESNDDKNITETTTIRNEAPSNNNFKIYSFETIFILNVVFIILFFIGVSLFACYNFKGNRIYLQEESNTSSFSISDKARK